MRFFLIIYWLFACLFLSVTSGISQNLNFEKFTTQNGLLSNEVYNLHQDKQGYIWLFTNYGAMKYNGKEFKQVLKNLPFNESFIYCIYENDKGQKWVANSNAKIYEIRNDSAFQIKGFEKTSEELKRTISEITHLIVDDTLNIYVSTKHYSYKFCKRKHYQAQNLSDLIPHDSILFQAIELKDDILGVVNYPGYDIHYFVLRFDSVNILHTKFPNQKDVYKVKCKMAFSPRLYKRYHEDIYFSFFTKMVKINHDKIISEILVGAQILNFVKDKNNNLWVATLSHGLYEYDEQGGLINHYFPNQTINCVSTDNQNGLWVSTTNGLYHCKDLNELSYISDKSLVHPIKFLKKIDSTLFIANNVGEILLINKNKQMRSYDKEVLLQEPQDIVKQHGLILLGYRNEVKEFNMKALTFSSYIHEKNVDFYANKLVAFDDDTLIAVQRKGIVIAANHKVLKTIYFNNKVYDAIVRNRTIFLATENGIQIIKNNQIYQPDYLRNTHDIILTAVKSDKEHNLWFCSKGYGLFILKNNNKLLNYNEAHGVPSNIINDISFDDVTDELMLSTNKGLFYLEDYQNIMGSWQTLYNEEVKTAAFYNNYVYIATNEGLVTINKRKLKENRLFYFNTIGVYVDKVKINDTLQKEFKYWQNNFDFHFDLISHDGINYKIKYELKGGKQIKNITDNNVVSFQNLPAGSYTFEVFPDIRNYPTSLFKYQFVIKPAFYKTWWFILGAFLLFFGVVAGGIKWYITYQRKRNLIKVETERLIYEYKLIALKAQINPHFMSNCLTAIQHLIITNKLDEANQYLAKFSLLVRQVMNFSTRPMVSIHEELQITELNVELEQLRFENKFVFELDIDDDCDINHVLMPPLIIQPIVENAIWHGLLPLKKIRQGILKIQIKKTEDLVYVIIEDNGIGRHKKNEGISNLENSKGIAVTEQRIQNLNVYYNTTKANLIYEDLTDILGYQIGTRVTIVLPMISTKDE